MKRLHRTNPVGLGPHFSVLFWEAGLFLVLTLFLVSCSKNLQTTAEEPSLPNQEDGTIENMRVASSFTFLTSREVKLQVSTLDNLNKAVPGIVVHCFDGWPEQGGRKIGSGITDGGGTFQQSFRVASFVDSLVIVTDAIGFAHEQQWPISGTQCNAVLGGRNPVPRTASRQVHKQTGFTTLGSGYIQPLSTFNSMGVPNNLVAPNDVIDAALLADVNAALPEYRPVPTYHPEYLNQTNQTNLEFTQQARVWVTFLHEGAGYKNVLGFYKYKVGSPPVTKADIDTIFVIYPNVSFVNSGGGLVSGNKVALGVFEPGTAIGWALIANGYNGSSITTGLNIFYSNHQLNPETNTSLKQHCILLNDINRDKLLLSFEDQRRDQTCDNDFNDAIFYVTADPIQAVSASNIPLPTYSTADADKDGVADNFDAYPTDASMSFNSYYPGENTVGTLSFEDLWPSKGDYDFNDMVVDYRFNLITNSQNKVVKINAAITPKAIGASYHNGFGIQFPFTSEQVSSVAGTEIRKSFIQKNANGTEANQSKATLIAFDDAFNILPWPGGTATGVNTTLGATYVQPRTLNIEIQLATPLAMNAIGQPPFNPFIFVNQERGKEVHLINNPPTDLADRSLLGTQHDNSNAALQRYYVTASNLPFAIDIAAPFDYPMEKKRVTDAHLKFYQWGTSNGTLYKDWFLPLAAYRNPNNIFSK